MLDVTFIDPCCPSPYVYSDLLTKGMGGTEATVLRVSKALADKGVKVGIKQFGREHAELLDGVLYMPIHDDLQAKNTVLLRIPSLASKYFKSNTPNFLWLHDAMNPNYFTDSYKNLLDFNTQVIGVSDWHKTCIQEVVKYNMSHDGGQGALKVKRIYNPVDDSLFDPNLSPYDRYKLVFFSTPQKGLVRTLELFMALLRVDNRYKLYIGNPGYHQTMTMDHPSVITLGVRPHAQMLGHVKDALCVFYPNHVFPETFGLVMAEANAVGTPVITHPIGATYEVLYHPSEMIDTRDNKAVIQRVMSWSDGGRPRVRGNDEFRISKVVEQWIKILNLKL